jgi:hypothetical protein
VWDLYAWTYIGRFHISPRRRTDFNSLKHPDGQALPAHQELSLRVFVNNDGHWQVAAFHNTMIAPFTPPAR